MNLKTPNVGIVVIGRNEGERLKACLDSLADINAPIVYVDSGSTDNSPELAGSYDIEVVNLDPSRPFSAARGRNEGYQHLQTLYPDIEFFQFIDGDCKIAPGWIEVASMDLRNNISYGAVTGHLQEMEPDASVYNRMCALEWKSAAGEITDIGKFGGISMIRAAVLDEVGGYNPDLIAGEEPELATRIKKAGYSIHKLDHSMAYHDAEISTFRQWWTRAVRAGHAIGAWANLTPGRRDKEAFREEMSTWFWGLLVPITILLLLIPTHGASLVLLLGYPVLAYRMYRYRIAEGDSPSHAITYAKYTLIGKFANVIGLIKYYRDKRRNSFRIIEYK
jgi:glycosyltransferase involved in cell wall biosynthesis